MDALGIIGSFIPPIANYINAKKAEKRPRILEIARLMVCPSIDILEKNIDNQKKQEYSIFSDTTESTKIRKIIQVYGYPRLKDDFYKQYPEIKDKTENWLREYDMLTTKLREIFHLILIDQDFLAITNGYADSHSLPSYIIDNLDSLPSNYICKQFWDNNAFRLLKLREKEGIRNKFSELKEINRKLLDHSKEILQAFRKIRETEKEKYDFTEDELTDYSDLPFQYGQSNNL